MENDEVVLDNGTIALRLSRLGAEPLSFVCEGKEYLWQGDPAVWKDHCYHIFPIVGRLRNDTYLLDGQSYPMGLHGFAKERRFEVLEQTKDRILFSIQDDAKTRKCYPFSFLFRIEVRLEGKRVTFAYEAENRGEADMPVSFGAHPGFQIDGDLSEYSLSLEEGGYTPYRLSPGRLVEGKGKHCLANTISLSDRMFLVSAKMFEVHASSLCLLRDGKPLLRMGIRDFPFLVLWNDGKKAPLLCIEPWQSLSQANAYAGDIRDREDIEVLPPKMKKKATWYMEVC